MTVPGFLTGSRYKATDSETPTWLTLYDISEPSIANGDGYQAVQAKASDNEKRIMPLVHYLNRRTYAPIGATPPPRTGASFPGKYVFSVGMDIKPEGEADFNKWYEEEHLGLVAKIPGWLSGRRYELVDSLVIGEGRKPLKYLAIYEMENNTFMETEEFKVAVGTPWSIEVQKNVLDRELRLFELAKVYKKSE